MKIEKSKAQQIIKEEVERAQKIQKLYEEKKRVLTQLKEMCGEGEVDEGKLARLFGAEVTKEEALQMINSNPNKKRAYEDAIKKDRGDLYLGFVMKHPNDPFFVWDPKLNNYVSATIKSDRSGLSGPRKYEESTI